MKKARKIVLIAVLSLLTACGYHLRGSIALPAALKNMYLFGASGALNAETKAVLKASDGKLANSPNDAGIVVKVLKEDFRRRVLSVGSTGKSSEVELNYYLRFQFYDNKENPLQEEQTIEISREFFNDQTAILAKENEESLIQKEIYRQAVRMLMSRAQAAIENRKL
ncbi:LPS-assembly lipoprotein LptE [Methylomonas rivi]|uniref:LPS-assembly lipoprotein LptE n=1 Tax=Methylomonas rivi TaxID=2952226 RepID=A0ABT1U0W9_9GAMM|nr:LPS assembly lipoprotein LptE [Methylomonas sp. WSC-6]MCQ8127218.1 LPS assembly lipoprotein LptE [Methylomonas sp. WSC-6]